MSQSRNQKKITFSVVGSTIQVAINTLCFFVIFAHGIRLLGNEIMGAFSLILAVVSLIKISDMGLSGAIIKYVAVNNKLFKFHFSASLILTTLLVVTFLYSILSITLYIFSDNLLNFILPSHLNQIISPLFSLMLINVFLTGLSVTFLACLDGMNRIDLRSAISIVSGLITMSSSFFLIQKYGLKGIIFSQMLQAALLITGCLVVIIRFYIKKIYKNPYFVDIKILFEYGIKFQLGSITSLISEALIRLLISRFGNISEIPYYEMARKLCDQLRILFASSATPIVPIIAGQISEKENKKENFHIYTKANELMLFFVVPTYTIVILSSLTIGFFLFNEISLIFSFFVLIMSLSSIISLSSVIPFNINLGTGFLKWNVISNVSFLFFMFVLTWPLSKFLGSIGSVLGIGLATFISSLFILIPYLNDNSIGVRQIFSKRILPLSFVCAFIIMLFSLFLFLIMFESLTITFLLALLIMTPIILILNMMLRSKIKDELINLMNLN